MNLSKDDKAPFSRVFVVCTKQAKEDDFIEPFGRHGEIESIFIPRDRNTGESKGIAYIQYNKTSSAAAAVLNLNLKTLEGFNRPLKVMIATNKNESFNEDKFKRLFIKVAKEATEEEIAEHFTQFGPIDFVHIQRDKSNEPRGFAYVKYNTFLDAAKALEECDRKYKPVFATPKEDIMKNKADNDYFFSPSPNIYNQVNDAVKRSSTTSLGRPQGSSTVSVTCSPTVHQKYLEKLFNVIPGMVGFQYNVDQFNGICKAEVRYEEEKSVALAVERLNNFEFPSGELVTVKPDSSVLSKAANELTNIVKTFRTSIDSDNPNMIHLAEAIAQASSLIQAATAGRIDFGSDESKSICSVTLPSPKPMLDANVKVAQRCFIVCKPSPPPLSILTDVFSRFGDLISVSIIPNKIFGFVKYGSAKAAMSAIKILNGATVCTSKLTVLEADERHKDAQMTTDDDYSHHENKRMKLDNGTA